MILAFNSIKNNLLTLSKMKTLKRKLKLKHTKLKFTRLI